MLSKGGYANDSKNKEENIFHKHSGRFQAYKTRCSNTKQPQQNPSQFSKVFKAEDHSAEKYHKKRIHMIPSFWDSVFYDKTFQ